MAVKEVLMLGDPVLREICEKVEIIDNKILMAIEDMADTLRDCKKIKNIGRAIAAPQIGVLKRIVVAESESLNQVFINPEIISRGEETFEVWDSCFSFDVAFFVKIKRFKDILVRFADEKGNIIEREYSDDLSELLQHEIDHLDGIMATDHLENLKDITMRSEWKKLMAMTT